MYQITAKSPALSIDPFFAQGIEAEILLRSKRLERIARFAA
jgi:hypothetical protein